MIPTDTIFGFPVHVEIEIGGVGYEVKDAIYVDRSGCPRLNLNRVLDVVTQRTRPCESCGTKPGETRQR